MRAATTMKIAIIDYGMGNLRSVEKAFHKVGAAGAFVTDDPAQVAAADKAVLPGDGAFDSTMHSLRRSGRGRDRAGVHRVRTAIPRHLRRDAGAADRQRGGRAGGARAGRRPRPRAPLPPHTGLKVPRSAGTPCDLHPAPRSARGCRTARWRTF